MKRYLLRRVEGYLTIYIALTLTVMLSLCLTLIEGARQSTIRLEAECMMDIALSSVMAEYHRELFAQYGLFFIDSAYGTSYPSYYNTEARLRYYLEKNMDMEEAEYLDLLYKDLLEMEPTNVYITEVTLATDEKGALFQKQAAQLMWEEAGLGLAEEVLDWVQVVETQGLLRRDMEAEKQAVDEQLEAHNQTRKELGKEHWITVEIINPTEHIETMRKQGILKWVLEKKVFLSGQKVELSQYISARRRKGQINQGNGLTAEAISEPEQILCHEYMLRYAGRYKQEKEGSLLKYQAEYLVAGKDSDVANLNQVAAKICAMREAANTLYLYQDKEKAGVADALAWLLSEAVFSPELQPLFKATLIMGWAYVESLYDTKLILAGGKVPLMKNAADWHYDLDSILHSVNMELKKENSKGMDYGDYLHVLLYLTDQEKLTFRFMDLMEMDIRMTEGNAAFRMDACIGAVEAEARIQSEYGYQFFIQRDKEYR